MEVQQIVNATFIVNQIFKMKQTQLMIIMTVLIIKMTNNNGLMDMTKKIMLGVIRNGVFRQKKNTLKHYVMPNH
jgi:hypothetical protein